MRNGTLRLRGFGRRLVSLEVLLGTCLLGAQLTNRQHWAGITPLAQVHEELALEAVDPVYPAWDIRLSILARQARRVSGRAR